ncbi:hypothetical protein C3F09_02285 [candidate division GN15 bacterium]|uniref:Uncharacterized protein n=1 Tax=candidate division GN15 bacterium TaxID=2072418 RepID=A0A855XA50_9BACT|nr:MAG: hypothetical protein C3F09_02285 [candidate division GN15 bacterium]
MTEPLNPLAVRISTPARESFLSRGFYQLEESSLYVPIGAGDRRRNYFSSLESEHVRFDIDRTGRLMFIEVIAARSTWVVSDNFELPVWAQPADIRFLGFRTSIPDPRILTDETRQRLLLRFSSATPEQYVSLADNVILTVDGRGAITSVIVNDIVDDLAGREIARFRAGLRTEPPVSAIAQV